MRILESEVEGYQNLREKAVKILTDCQNLTDFSEVYKNTGINLAKDYSDIYLAYEQFQTSVLMTEEMPEKDYLLNVGAFNERISIRIKSVQTVACRILELKSKVEQFNIAQSEIYQYLLGIID